MIGPIGRTPCANGSMQQPEQAAIMVLPPCARVKEKWRKFAIER